MRNNSQTNREKTKKSSTTTSESLSAPTNNDTTTMMIIDRKISLATEGLQPCFENWLRIRTSNALIRTFITTFRYY